MKYTVTIQKLYVNPVDRKITIYAFLALFLTVYFLQPLAVNIFEVKRPLVKYDGYFFSDYVLVYSFVVASTLIFFTGVIIGLSGTSTTIKMDPISQKVKQSQYFKTRLIFLVAVFVCISYFMLINRAGITIYREGAGLPYRMEGILHYSRIFLIPLILIYLINKKVQLTFSEKLLATLSIFIMGSVGSITSGSRLIGGLYASIIIFVFDRKLNIISILLILASINLFLASWTRVFIIPFYLGEDYIQQYNNIDQIASINDKNYFVYLLGYIIQRAMGVYEALLVLDHKFQTTFYVSTLGMISFIQPFLHLGAWGNVKEVYNVTSNTGFNTDFISSIYVKMNGFLSLHFFIMCFSGLISGRIIRNFSLLFQLFDFEKALKFIILLCILLVFENRNNILILMYLTSVIFLWFLQLSYFFRRSRQRK